MRHIYTALEGMRTCTDYPESVRGSGRDRKIKTGRGKEDLGLRNDKNTHSSVNIYTALSVHSMK